MFTPRYIVIGIILAGLLAGWGSMSENGLHPILGGTLLIMGVVYVGIRMVGGLFARSSNDGMYQDTFVSATSRPTFQILEEGKDAKGRPYFIIQGDSRDASRLTKGWTYPGAVSWVHTHIGHYKWNVHIEDWDV